MKKIILVLSLIGTLLSVSTGCGSDGDKKIDPKDVVIKFKTNATYDLSNYFFPSIDQTNNYVHKNYTNDKGEKKYSNTPNETTYSIINYETNNTTIKEYFDNNLDVTHTIQNDKMRQLDNEDNSVINLPRYVDKGDYIIKKEYSFVESGINFEYISICKVSNHINSKEINNKTYEDIIEVTCSSSSTSLKDAKLNGVPYSYTIETTIQSLLAKNKSLIMETTESCTNVTVNTTTDKSCDKEIVEITTISN